MIPATKRLVQAGFTLVELLIVVIILAILAAIVIPQFNSASTDTKEAALDANLAAMRNAIELYKAQHGSYPGAKVSSGGTCPSGSTAGTGGADTATAFTDQLLNYSNSAGQTCTVGDGTFKYGPYLRKGIPVDPIYNSNAVDARSGGTPLAPSAATGGWMIDTKSGQIVLNSNANDSSGSKTYAAH